jgi:hypothetical protein
MKKVKIELGKRLTLFLSFILLISLFSVVVYAKDNNKAKNRGHSLDEIDGLEEYVIGLVENVLSDFMMKNNNSCSESSLVFASGIEEKPGVVSVTLPQKCFSLEGCTFVQQVSSSKGVYKFRSISFGQDSSNKWWSTDTKGGNLVNGDKTASVIMTTAVSGITVTDDNTKVEKESGTISIGDVQKSYGQKVWIC